MAKNWKNDKAVAPGVDGVTLYEYLRTTATNSVAALERALAEAETAANKEAEEKDTAQAMGCARALSRRVETISNRFNTLASVIERTEMRMWRKARAAKAGGK